MSKNMKNRKPIKSKLVNVTPPSKIPLPFNGVYAEDVGFTFSFACFDREHELFNLGGKNEDGTIGGKWFLELLDCLKSVSGKTVEELKRSTHGLHPVDWNGVNTQCPTEQGEYWQFRVDKSSGRVIGLLIDGVFYVVWLDPYHNLTDSDHYESRKKFPKPT